MQAFQDAFISYGRVDSKAFAAKLNRHLVAHGLTVWFDFDDIPLGVDYQKQIDDGIDKADNFLFLISPHSVNSDYCHLEIELALKRNKRIITLLHVEQISRETWQQRNPTKTDADWDAYQAEGRHSCFSNIHPAISKINWVDFREEIDEFEASFNNLLAIFDRHREYVHQHTVLLTKSLEWEQQQKRSPYLLIGEERLQAEAWLKTQFQDSQPPCVPTDLHCEFITESRKNADNLMTEVFLAYADDNRTVAKQIRASLWRAGFTVWTNTTDIQAGADFQQVIDRGIEAADNVVYLLSNAAVKSPYCQHELEYALSLNKRIIPVLVEAIAPDQIPLRLRDLQYIDLTDNEQETDYQQDERQLLRILRQDAAYHTDHKLLLTKALKWERQQRNPTLLLRGYNLRHAEAWLKMAKQQGACPPLPLQAALITESLRQPPGVSLDVFISYSRADSGFARRLNDALQIQGKRTWFDQESIAAGTADFQQEIHKGIESADTFLFVLSPRSLTSPYCASEVEYAASLNKRFVTVLHQPIDPSTLHPELAKVQWLDFNRHEGDFSANFTELLRILDTDSDHLHAHTRLLLRAIEWDSKGRRESLLLRGDDLEQAEQWLAQSVGKEPHPTELQHTYVNTSRSVEEANQQAAQILQAAAAKGNRFVRVGVIVGVIGLLVAGWAYLYQAKARQEAANAKAQATEAEQQAANAKAQATEAEQQAADARQAQENAKRALEDAQAQQRAAQQRLDLANAQVKEAAQSLQQANRSRADAVAQATAAQDQKERAERAARQAESAKQQADLQVRVAGVGLGIATAKERLQLGLPFQALLAALEAGKTLRTQFQENSSERQALQPRVIAVVQQAINETYEKNTLEGHQGGVSSISFSPDGKTLASGSGDSTIKLWSVETGKEIRTLQTNQGGVYSISFSPDGKTLASGGDDRNYGSTITLWSVETGKEIRTLQGSQAASISFSPDGKTLAIGGNSSAITLWSMETGEEIRTLQGHQDLAASISFSPDGKTLASGSFYITLWSVETGAEIRTLQGHQGGLTSISFSPDGKTLVSGSDNTITLWSVETGEEIRTLQGHQGGLTSISFSPDGKTLASGSEDSTIKLWSVETGAEICTFQGHQGGVSSISFSPDGKTLASGSEDSTIKLWSMETGVVLRTLQTNQDEVSSISFSPDSKTLASGSDDDSASGSDDSIIKLWSVETGEEIRTLRGHQGGVSSISFSPDGKTLASGSDDDSASGSDDSIIKLWSVETGEEIRTLRGHQGGVRSISFSPDGKTLASAGYDRTIKLWSVETGEVLRTFQTNQVGVTSISFSPDGKTLASGSLDGTIKLWSVETGEVLRTFQTNQVGFRSISFSPDDKTLASGGYDRTIKLWSLETGEVLRTLQGHQDTVNSISYSPDGKTLVSGGEDSIIKLWSVETGAEIRTLQGRQRGQGIVNIISFSPDGKTIASGSRDGTIKIWVWDFDRLMTMGCDWIKVYLITHERDRPLCNGYLPDNP